MKAEAKKHMYQSIIEKVDALAPQMVAWRRDFHKYAEAGWLEMRTSSLIARYLTDLGYEVLVGEQVCKREERMGVPPEAELKKAYERAIAQGADPLFVKATEGGMTGVIGILRCGEGPTIAMRFDIDALGVFESSDEDHFPAKAGFASVNEGEMHACGHDAHAASGLGVATILMEMKEQLHGTIKLIFQPSEEGLRGAKSIVENGHLEGVDYLLGAHTTGLDAAGSDITPGSEGSLASYKYDVTFRGVSAHAGGNPHKGKNALLAAATAVTNLYAIPRHAAGATRINVGRLIAGSGRNVIPDEAFMEIEVRGNTTDINEFVSDYALRILKASAEMHDCTMELKKMGAAESITGCEEFSAQIKDVCKNHMGLKVSDNLLMKLQGSEDFSYMTNYVLSHGGKASFMRVRSATVAGAHNRKYDFDESYMTKAAKAFCGMAYELMK